MFYEIMNDWLWGVNLSRITPIISRLTSCGNIDILYIKLIIVPSVVWIYMGFLWKLLDHCRNIRIYQAFFTKIIQPVWDDEGERKERKIQRLKP